MVEVAGQIGRWVEEAVHSTPVYDLHTHLYPAEFGGLMLWGIDELLTYHYLIAEAIRASDVGYEAFWGMSKREQAEFIWRTLFVERSPISEACRGVLTVLKRLGLDVGGRTLRDFRDFFGSQKPADYVDLVLKVANVRGVVMTNDALDAVEREIWLKRGNSDGRFKAVLRIDPVLTGWPGVADRLRGAGYGVGLELGAESMKEIRRFLREWMDRMGALYVAVSLGPEWRYPDNSATTKVIREAVLPVTKEKGVPFAMMVGVKRQVNPKLRLAGDGVGLADVGSVERICVENEGNKFLVTMLARENQHELAVAARKLRNLMLFGCWWFLNNPSLIEEITRMRVELLGTSFVPQHSDARVLDQVIYKWDHSRGLIAQVMKEKFVDLAGTGWVVTEEEVKRTAAGYLGGNFEAFMKRDA